MKNYNLSERKYPPTPSEVFPVQNQYKLPKDFVMRWLKALRSGEFKQTRMQLTDYNGRYCCLGVACLVLDIDYGYISEHNKSCIASLGFYNKGIPQELDEGLHKKLTDMNDIDNMSFPEIADWIEQNVELF